MYQHKPIGRAFLLTASMCILVMGITATAMSAENDTEILKITVGKATKLTPMSHQNTSKVMASRTGVVAVFFPKPPRGIKKYRVSTYAGLTWGQVNARWVYYNC